jgi:hypothetical protein
MKIKFFNCFFSFVKENNLGMENLGDKILKKEKKLVDQ